MPHARRMLIPPRPVFLFRGRGMGDINTIAQAVQSMEGYCGPNTTWGCAPCAPGGSCQFPSGTVAWQNNNPGNLQYAGQPGSTQNGRWARFSSYDSGYQALLSQIQRQADSGQTLEQFIYQYAPPNENNTREYLSSLETATGYPRSAPLTAVLAGSTFTPAPIPAELSSTAPTTGDADANTFPDDLSIFDPSTWIGDLSAGGSSDGSGLPGWAVAAIPAALILALVLRR